METQTLYILVLSAKGGVGKSTLATALATVLSERFTVALIDVDMTNPSIPKLAGVEGQELRVAGMVKPVDKGRLKVASISLVLAEKGLPIIWDGEFAGLMATQFFSSIDWGDTEHYVIDTPPGTSDEALDIITLFAQKSGAVIVTAPQQLSVDNVSRTISLCKEKEIPIIGLVENMSGFKCPKCGKTTPLGSEDAAKVLAAEEEVNYLGEIPLDPRIGKEGDQGIVETISGSEGFKSLLSGVIEFLGAK